LGSPRNPTTAADHPRVHRTGYSPKENHFQIGVQPADTDAGTKLQEPNGSSQTKRRVLLSSVDFGTNCFSASPLTSCILNRLCFRARLALVHNIAGIAHLLSGSPKAQKQGSNNGSNQIPSPQPRPSSSIAVWPGTAQYYHTKRMIPPGGFPLRSKPAACGLRGRWLALSKRPRCSEMKRPFFSFTSCDEKEKSLPSPPQPKKTLNNSGCAIIMQRNNSNELYATGPRCLHNDACKKPVFGRTFHVFEAAKGSSCTIA
jgi:hypothetical protein